MFSLLNISYAIFISLMLDILKVSFQFVFTIGLKKFTLKNLKSKENTLLLENSYLLQNVFLNSK